MPNLIAVTGSTGHLGGLVAHQLSEAGIPLRQLVRSAERAPVLPGSEVVEATYGDHAASLAALEGIELLFMVSAAENEQRRHEHLTFVDAAADAGVRHIVYTSFVGAAPDATFTLARDHWATEERIKERGIGHTFLRDNLYLDFVPYFAGDAGVIRGPAGDGLFGGVTRADVARTASAILLAADAHLDRTYDLTGPEAISMTDAARILSEVAGRPITYVDETMDEAYASRASYGAPEWQLDAWVSTYAAVANGEMAVVSPTVREISGKEPMSLRDFLLAAERL